VGSGELDSNCPRPPGDEQSRAATPDLRSERQAIRRQARHAVEENLFEQGGSGPDSELFLPTATWPGFTSAGSISTWPRCAA